jgi:hypothetical protein
VCVCLVCFSVRNRLTRKWRARVCVQVDLHRLLLKHAPELVADTVVVEARGRYPPRLPDQGVWIWRPEGGWSGKGVVVVPDQRSLDRAWEQHVRSGKRALLSRYITDPMLMPGGFKFHVRLHLLVVVTPQGKRVALYRRGEIVRSGQPFVLQEYGLDKIHDTHMRYNQPRAFPEDFPGGEEAAAAFHTRVHGIFQRVCALALPNVRSYAESDGGFEIYGCDLMLDREGRIYLIEVNLKPLFLHPHGEPDRVVRLSRHLFGGLAEYVLNDPGPDATNLTHVVEVMRC